MHAGGFGLGLQSFTQFAVGQHLGDLGQDLQVPLGGGLGHEQEDQQRHRLVVRGVEGDGLLHADHRGERVLQALDAAMRDGHAVAQAGGAEALAGEEVVGDGGAGHRVLVLEQQAGLLESALLARGVDVDDDVGRREDGSETVHQVGAQLRVPVMTPAGRQTMAVSVIVRLGHRPATPRMGGTRHCAAAAATQQRGTWCTGLRRPCSGAWPTGDGGSGSAPCGGRPGDPACPSAGRWRRRGPRGSPRRRCPCPSRGG